MNSWTGTTGVAPGGRFRAPLPKGGKRSASRHADWPSLYSPSRGDEPGEHFSGLLARRVVAPMAAVRLRLQLDGHRVTHVAAWFRRDVPGKRCLGDFACACGSGCRSRVGRSDPGLWAAGGLVLALVLFTLTAFKDQAGLTSTVINVTPWGPCIALELLVLTSRVEGRGDSLVLVDLVRTAIIPISVIAKVDRTNGVHVVLADGRRLGCIGYGSSVIALFTDNHRGAATRHQSSPTTTIENPSLLSPRR